MPYRSDGIGHARTDTSEAAAEDISGKAPSLRERVFAYLQRNGPATSCRIARGLKVRYSSIQPRLSELRNERKVFDSGRRMASLDTSKPVIVWTTDPSDVL